MSTEDVTDLDRGQILRSLLGNDPTTERIIRGFAALDRFCSPEGDGDVVPPAVDEGLSGPQSEAARQCLHADRS